jgi:hypothetical protein
MGICEVKDNWLNVRLCLDFLMYLVWYTELGALHHGSRKAASEDRTRLLPH